jgi:methylmalonyl-CoA mutase N-terminal domain/subunit
LDEALALPSEHSVTIALRTQQIIAEESGVTNTVDPLGGSYFVEAQTDRMEKDAYAYFRRIEDLGGVIPAIEKGFMQGEIADAAYRYQREIDTGIRKIVGVNAYAEDKPLVIPILKMDPNGYTRQINRLKEVRKTRDSGRVGQTLDKLRIACEGTENTMPYIMECVHAYCTLGEIVGVMTKVFGKYEETAVI